MLYDDAMTITADWPFLLVTTIIPTVLIVGAMWVICRNRHKT